MRRLAILGCLTILFGACSDVKTEKKKEKQKVIANKPVSATPVNNNKKTPPAATPTPANPNEPPGLRDPSQASEKAPDIYKAKFTTTEGDFVIEVNRGWSPAGADRFYNLVKIGYYNDVAFFRNVEGFMVQFGINGDPSLNTIWKEARIPDDPGGSGQSNLEGYVTFAKASIPNSRTTQVFINFGDNSNLDPMGFTPFGKVVEGFDVVKKLYNGYGDAPPGGMGPNQGMLQTKGNAYLKESFPELDYIKTATILP